MRVCPPVFHIIFRTRKYKNRPLKSLPDVRPGLYSEIMSSLLRLAPLRKTNSAIYISCSFLFTWNRNDKYVNFIPVHRLRSSLKNHTVRTIPDSRPKQAKCIPVFRPKRPKNATRCGGLNLYGLCKGKPSGIQLL